MNIAVTIPSFHVHGGIRIILEWANRLAANHTVFLRVLKPYPVCKWFPIDRRVRIMTNDRPLRDCDLLIITSPHAAHYLDSSLVTHHSSLRIAIFLQMLEHLFRPGQDRWQEQCEKLYRAPVPMIVISRWNQRLLQEEFGRNGSVTYVGNGINFDHFPLAQQDGPRRSLGEGGHSKTVLIEGSWGCHNPTKDPDCIAPKVAARLKRDGYYILAYSAHPPQQFSGLAHKHFFSPSLSQLNQLYSEATILLKASRYDARALAPLEAMTKGVPTARAIIEGDDDLIDGQNCLRCDYDEEALYQAATRLLKDDDLRHRLSRNCLDYVQREASWQNWWPKIEEILFTEGNKKSESSLP